MKKLLLLSLAALATLFVACNNDKPQIEESKVPVYKTLSVAEFAKQANSDTYYHIKGTVESVLDAHYSQFVLKDASGSVSVSGLWDSEGGSRVYDMAGFKVGDAISIAAQHNEYKGQAEAKNAFVYDPAKVSVWVKPTNFNVPAEGGEYTAEMYVLEAPQITCDQAWVKADFNDAENKLILDVQANTQLDSRVAVVSITCKDNTVKIRVSQAAYTPALLRISEAISEGLVRVQGTVVAADAAGYILADESGALYVKADSFLGIDLGTGMEVTGNIATADHHTCLTPVISNKGAKTEYSLAPVAQNADEFAALAGRIAGASATEPALAQCVKLEGKLEPGQNGNFNFTDKKTKAVLAVVNNSGLFDLESLCYKVVELCAFTAEYTDGALHLVPASAEEIPFVSIISIDGEFEDWDNPAIAVSDVHEASYPALAEIRGYVDQAGIYIYYRSELRSYLHNSRICIDTDGNPETGAKHWCLPDSGYEVMINLTPFSAQGIYTAPDGGDTLVSSLNGSVLSMHTEDQAADTSLLEMMIPRDRFEAEFPLTSDHINVAIYSLGNPYWNKTGTLPSDHALRVNIVNE